MTTGLKSLLIGFLLTGLFAYVFITGGILLSTYNNPANSIGDDPSLSEYKTSLEEDLEQAYADANSSESSFSDSPITLGGGDIILDSISGIWKTAKSMPVTIYNLTVGLTLRKIFGSEAFAIVFGVLAAIISITIIFYVWRMIKSGES